MRALRLRIEDLMPVDNDVAQESPDASHLLRHHLGFVRRRRAAPDRLEIIALVKFLTPGERFGQTKVLCPATCGGPFSSKQDESMRLGQQIMVLLQWMAPPEVKRPQKAHRYFQELKRNPDGTFSARNALPRWKP
jgi:hypothetical protein